MIRIALALVLGAAPVAAEDAVTWLQDGIGIETRIVEAGTWHPVGGQLHATDPLTLFQTAPHVSPLAVPDAPAAVIGLHHDAVFGDVTEPRNAALVLVWSDAPVICGEDLATIAVDSGLAAFITPDEVDALHWYEDRYGPSYVRVVPGPLQRQIETASPGPFITDVPRDLHFPISGAGWGDGAYPVVSLLDAEGNMVALYTQFITDGENWFMPPPCPDSHS